MGPPGKFLFPVWLPAGVLKQGWAERLARSRGWRGEPCRLVRARPCREAPAAGAALQSSRCRPRRRLIYCPPNGFLQVFRRTLKTALDAGCFRGILTA